MAYNLRLPLHVGEVEAGTQALIISHPQGRAERSDWIHQPPTGSSSLRLVGSRPNPQKRRAPTQSAIQAVPLLMQAGRGTLLGGCRLCHCHVDGSHYTEHRCFKRLDEQWRLPSRDLILEPFPFSPNDYLLNICFVDVLC